MLPLFGICKCNFISGIRKTTKKYVLKPCMYCSSGLLNQVLLDGLADWAVQAGINQINQFFAKYPHFSGSKFTFFDHKKSFLKKFLVNRVRTTILITIRQIASNFRNGKVDFLGLHWVYNDLMIWFTS